MTIYYATHDPEEWYLRPGDAVCSPPLAVVGEDDIYEFCFWTSRYELVCLLSDLLYVAGQSVLLAGGWAWGKHYKHCAMVKVHGADSWNDITVRFDNWLLGPVWGKAITETVLEAESNGW